MIRDAVASDLPAIVDIYNSTISSRSATADLQPVTVTEREPWFAAHSPRRRPLWVAQRDGEVLAWLSLEDFRRRPAYDVTAEVGVYVRADRRRQGLGSMLLGHAVSAAPQLGLVTLLALIFAHNAPSVALFRGEAFQEWGRLRDVCRLDDERADVLLLGRGVAPTRG